MTAYLILERREIPTENVKQPAWIAGKRVQAASAKAAVKAFVEQNGAKGGEYVAIPERNWRPVKVAVEQKATLKFS